MDGRRTRRAPALVALLAGVLLALLTAPAAALAAWTDVRASIVDRRGTGVVPFLNVSLDNQASNDAAHVTTVQLSDDGLAWYALPYTGEVCAWVLAGEAGHKQLYVRFGAADGSVSPVVTAAIDVDTVGPATVARSASPAAGGRTLLRYAVSDRGSSHVDAAVVVKGGGVTKRFDLGRVAVGSRTARLRLGLRPGMYSWRVQATDLAGRSQVRQVAGRLVVR